MRVGEQRGCKCTSMRASLQVPLVEFDFYLFCYFPLYKNNTNKEDVKFAHITATMKFLVHIFLLKSFLSSNH